MQLSGFVLLIIHYYNCLSNYSPSISILSNLLWSGFSVPGESC
jgi:hypothetical protein